MGPITRHNWRALAHRFAILGMLFDTETVSSMASIQFIRLFPPPLLLDPPQTRGGNNPGGSENQSQKSIMPKNFSRLRREVPPNKGGINPRGGINPTDCIDVIVKHCQSRAPRRSSQSWIIHFQQFPLEIGENSSKTTKCYVFQQKKCMSWCDFLASSWLVSCASSEYFVRCRCAACIFLNESNIFLCCLIFFWIESPKKYLRDSYFYQNDFIRSIAAAHH